MNIKHLNKQFIFFKKYKDQFIDAVKINMKWYIFHSLFFLFL